MSLDRVKALTILWSLRLSRLILELMFSSRSLFCFWLTQFISLLELNKALSLRTLIWFCLYTEFNLVRAVDRQRVDGTLVNFWAICPDKNLFCKRIDFCQFLSILTKKGHFFQALDSRSNFKNRKNGHFLKKCKGSPLTIFFTFYFFIGHQGTKSTFLPPSKGLNFHRASRNKNRFGKSKSKKNEFRFAKI